MASTKPAATRSTPQKPRHLTPGAPLSTTVRHPLHVLLHTVRTIGQFEDELCTLLHEVERNDSVSPELSAELLALLETIPSHEYLHDLNTLGIALSQRPHGATKVEARKRSAAQAKAPNAKSKARAVKAKPAAAGKKRRGTS